MEVFNHVNSLQEQWWRQQNGILRCAQDDKSVGITWKDQPLKL